MRSGATPPATTPGITPAPHTTTPACIPSAAARMTKSPSAPRWKFAVTTTGRGGLQALPNRICCGRISCLIRRGAERGYNDEKESAVTLPVAGADRRRAFGANAETPANVSVAPAISAATLQSLPWQPLQPPVSQEVKLDAVSPQLNQGEIQGRSPPIRCRPIAVRWK